MFFLISAVDNVNASSRKSDDEKDSNKYCKLKAFDTIIHLFTVLISCCIYLFIYLFDYLKLGLFDS